MDDATIVAVAMATLCEFLVYAKSFRLGEKELIIKVYIFKIFYRNYTE